MTVKTYNACESQLDKIHMKYTTMWHARSSQVSQRYQIYNFDITFDMGMGMFIEDVQTVNLLELSESNINLLLSLRRNKHGGCL